MNLKLVEEIFDPDSPSPLPVSGHKVLYHEKSDCLYLIGGWNPEHVDNFDGNADNFDVHYVRQVWCYNFARKQWRKLKSAHAPMSLASHCCTWLNDRQIFVYGGSLSTKGLEGNSNKSYIYDISDEKWTPLTTKGDICPQLCGHWFGQALCSDGREEIYVLTGFMSSTFEPGTTKVHALNLKNLTWRNLTSSLINSSSEENLASRQRVRHDAVVYDGKIYVIGGGEKFLYNCYPMEFLPCFDLKCLSWRLAKTKADPSSENYPPHRQCQATVIFGSKILVCGGLCQSSEQHSITRVLKDMWILDLESLQWRELNMNLPRPLWFHSMDICRIKTTIYIFGGCTNPGYQERCDSLFRFVNLPQTLEELCWRNIVNLTRNFQFLNDINVDRRALFSLNLPRKFIERLLVVYGARI